MSCWVVPSLAADIWQIPLELIWRRIRAGEIPIREENGFTFVDVAPYGPRLMRPNLPPDQRPRTYAAVEAPSEQNIDINEPESPVLAKIEPSEQEDEEMGPADQTASANLGDWRIARRRNSRLRVPPLKWRLSA